MLHSSVQTTFSKSSIYGIISVLQPRGFFDLEKRVREWLLFCLCCYNWYEKRRCYRITPIDFFRIYQELTLMRLLKGRWVGFQFLMLFSGLYLQLDPHESIMTLTTKLYPLFCWFNSYYKLNLTDHFSYWWINLPNVYLR